MWLVSACAALAVVQSALTDSCSSLGVALGAVFAAVLSETLIWYRTGRPLPVRDGSAVASALILALLLPNRIHPAYAVAGAAFAMAVVKHSFGGLGANWLNPAAAGWLFVRFSWPAAYLRALEEGPGLTGPYMGADSAAALVRDFLNRGVFSFTGSELPEGYINLLMSPLNGIIADRGIGALLLGSVFICASQVNRVWVPALYLACYGILIRIFGALPLGGGWGQGDVLLGFFSGGTMAAAFLLAGDSATGAKSRPGVFIVSAGTALFSFLFRYPGGEPYGALLAVLFLNALVPLIRKIESRRFYGKRRGP
jgi:electron transport complex protein RnfD